MRTLPPDIEIARAAELRPITEIAAQLGLTPSDLDPYGRYKAKVNVSAARGAGGSGKLVLVSAVTPTPAGEGKTTVTVGLGQALGTIGKRGAISIREPSLGPCMGMKGGATGGGRAQVLPMEDINLHFTGDLHAISAANNLLAAMVDNHIYFRGEPGIDPRRVAWRRVMDMNDRCLRNAVIGLGGPVSGVPRETGFDITAASEVMAVLCLADDLEDLEARLGRMIVGYGYDREPITAADLDATGAMTALLRDAMKPNLVQTLDHTPAFVHGGPFANIAHGTSSVIAARTALSLADYVVTEAGFGFDLGAEKFFDIMCRQSGLSPSCVVLVATVRALKMHGGVAVADLGSPDPEAVARGLPNLEKHLETLRSFGVPEVVAINRFSGDTEAEIDVIRQRCDELKMTSAVCNAWQEGGAGATELAEKVVERADGFTGSYRPLYSLEDTVEQKIETIARKVYGAEAVDFTARAKKDINRIRKLGVEALPVCIAKTQKSLSDNPKLLGRPKDFVVTVREVLVSAGAGFLVPITGDIMRMPGLPRRPAALDIRLDAEGRIHGLA